MSEKCNALRHASWAWHHAPWYGMAWQASLAWPMTCPSRPMAVHHAANIRQQSDRPCNQVDRIGPGHAANRDCGHGGALVFGNWRLAGPLYPADEGAAHVVLGLRPTVTFMFGGRPLVAVFTFKMHFSPGIAGKPRHGRKEGSRREAGPRLALRWIGTQYLAIVIGKLTST